MKKTKRTPIQSRVPIILDKHNNCPYKEPFGYIYKIINRVNGHYYIGKHEFHYPWLDKSYRGSGRKLRSAYRKHGIENFETSIIEWTNKDNSELNNLEIYWIDIFGAYIFPQHYNLTEGGDGFTPDEEIKEKISKANTGKKRTHEQIERLRNIAINMNSQQYLPILKGKNNPMYGVHKYGKDNPNFENYWTDTQKQNLSDKLTGKTVSQDTRKLWSLQRKGKQKGSSNPHSKAIVQLTKGNKLIRHFSFMSEAEQFGYNRNSIRQCCTHKIEFYKGYKWLYFTEYQNLFNIDLV